MALEEMAMAARVLVVDDDPDTLQMLGEVLAEGGYEAVLRSRPPDDADELSALSPDLVVLDWIFGRDPLGIRMLEQLALGTMTARIPVIICTAAPHRVRENDVFEKVHVAGVLHKPFMLDDLLYAIRLALQ